MGLFFMHAGALVSLILFVQAQLFMSELVVIYPSQD